jgi:hypothetical protein
MVGTVTAGVIGALAVVAVGSILYGAYLKGRVDKGNQWDVVSYNDIIQYRALESEVNSDADEPDS